MIREVEGSVLLLHKIQFPNSCLNLLYDSGQNMCNRPCEDGKITCRNFTLRCVCVYVPWWPCVLCDAVTLCHLCDTVISCSIVSN